MRKFIITLAFVLGVIGVTMLGLCLMQKEKPENETHTKPKTTNVMTGKVTEVISDTEILIEITKERGSLFLGDIVRVEYETLVVEELNIPDIPKVGDCVSTVFAEEDLKEENLSDTVFSISAKEVYKHTTDSDAQ